MKIASIQARLLPAGTFVLRFIPRRVAIVVAYFVADVSRVLSRTWKRAVDNNLARTAPLTDRTRRRHLRRATFRHLAAVWVDYLRLPLLTRGELHALVHWHTKSNLDSALRQGKGVVIVTAHVGALDLAGVYLASHGYPISAVVEDIAPEMYAVYRRYREGTGMRVLSRGRSAVANWYRALNRGEIVALVVDRVIDGPRVEVDFCGDRRVVPSGPAAFARRAGAPIVVLQITRTADGSGYDLVTGPAMTPDGSTEALTSAIAAELTTLVSRFPDQWFVFDDGWLSQLAGRPAPPVHPQFDRGVP